MAETIEIRPSATKSSTGKSMTMGGMALVRTLSWPTYLLYSAIFLTLGILILAGGAAVGALLSNIVFDGRYVWLVSVCAVAAPLFAIWGYNLSYRILGRACDRASLQRNARLRFTPDGMVFTNGRSHWQTSWQDVDVIRLSGEVVAFVASGVVFPALKTDFPHGALEKVQAWHRTARG